MFLQTKRAASKSSSQRLTAFRTLQLQSFTETGQLRFHLGLTADLLQRFDNGDWGAGVSGVAGVEFEKWVSETFPTATRKGELLDRAWVSSESASRFKRVPESSRA